jgi:hypothetical protein
MSARKKTTVQEEVPAHVTLQVPPAVKQVLKMEQAKSTKFTPMGEIVAVALSEYFQNPEYDKILREAGLID